MPRTQTRAWQDTKRELGLRAHVDSTALGEPLADGREYVA